jgi:hypothetical protein
MTETKVVKITKRDNINSLLKREDLTENERSFLMHELELLDKKNAYKASKNAEKNAENDKLKNDIFSILTESDKGLTTSVIANKLSADLGKNITPQKVRPQLTALIAEEVVENYKEKGVSLFRVVG